MTKSLIHKFRNLTAAAATAGLMVLAAPVSPAHDLVIGGNPDNGDVVEEFPEIIELEFSGYVKLDFNTFAISDIESGEILFSGPPTIDGRMVSIAVPTDVNPGPGDYRIGFQITSSDGHSTRGMTTFTVAGERDAASTAAESTTDVASDAAGESGVLQNPLTWILAGVGILAILGVIVMAIARGQKTTQE
ncbi:copper resistance CopC family protein [Corynebacterium sp.]|uniref:copper resistance CopC family protein n=1 Tax=Corynebacterium sp. TaxID=1720 RepID=UPI003432E51C